MNKKKITILLVAIIALTVPFSVFAATSNAPVAKSIRGFLGIDSSKLSVQQKADVTTYTQKMADLQKEFVNKMVANGSITKEQGAAEIEKIDDMVKNGDTNALLPGNERGRGGRFGNGGMPGRFGLFGIDITTLTDNQKADLIASNKSMAELQKTFITKIVANGLLTKSQGDKATKKVDALITVMSTVNIKNIAMYFGPGNLKFFAMKDVDLSKLTTVQKADFKDYSTQMTALQKTLVNKMVTNSALTKDQGDQAIKRIDEMASRMDKNGLSGNFKMKEGRFGGHGKGGISDPNATPRPTTSGT